MSLAGGLLGESFFYDVVGLSLQYEQQLADDDLADVGELLYLKRLNLELTDIGDQGIRWLRGLRGVEQLDVGSTRVTGAGLERLKRSKALKSPC